MFGSTSEGFTVFNYRKIIGLIDGLIVYSIVAQ